MITRRPPFTRTPSPPFRFCMHTPRGLHPTVRQLSRPGELNGSRRASGRTLAAGLSVDEMIEHFSRVSKGATGALSVSAHNPRTFLQHFYARTLQKTTRATFRPRLTGRVVMERGVWPEAKAHFIVSERSDRSRTSDITEKPKRYERRGTVANRRHSSRQGAAVYLRQSW